MKRFFYTVYRMTFCSKTKFVGHDNQLSATVKAYRDMTGYVSHAFFYKMLIERETDVGKVVWFTRIPRTSTTEYCNCFSFKRFSNDLKNQYQPKLRPITTGANSASNQSEFLTVTCNLLKAREKSQVQGAVGFGFAFSIG